MTAPSFYHFNTCVLDPVVRPGLCTQTYACESRQLEIVLEVRVSCLDEISVVLHDRYA